MEEDQKLKDQELKDHEMVMDHQHEGKMDDLFKKLLAGNVEHVLLDPKNPYDNGCDD